MEHYAQNSAKTVLDFYMDLIENDSAKMMFYLADNVVLDWFGKTVKESKKVGVFIREHVCKITHQIASVASVESVAFKETHHVKVPNRNESVSPPLPQGPDVNSTPKSMASTSGIEMGQGDGVHNNYRNPLSPPKKIKLDSVLGEDDTETIEGETEQVSSQLKYLTAEGTVEFYRPSIKKLQSESKWKRPIKLHLGYTTDSFKDCTIYLIIYEGNLKCRRNLFKEFCDSENEGTKS